jgi:putative addiction module component (TIGR02574 family)
MLMSSSRTAVFDLSVSEKIQLLEDPWDDIASDPSAVPLHDWQQEELNRIVFSN